MAGRDGPGCLPPTRSRRATNGTAFRARLQIRRAATSIPAMSPKEHAHRSDRSYLRHVRIALGSLFELDTQLELACRQGLIETQGLESLEPQSREPASSFMAFSALCDDASTSRLPPARAWSWASCSPQSCCSDRLQLPNHRTAELPNHRATENHLTTETELPNHRTTEPLPSYRATEPARRLSQPRPQVIRREPEHHGARDPQQHGRGERWLDVARQLGVAQIDRLPRR